MTAKRVHVRLSDLRGFHRLATDATLGLTDLVEAMHHAVARVPGRTSTGHAAGITGLVYASIRGVARRLGAGIDALLDLLPPLLENRQSSDAREAVLAALNGVLGDHLAATGNPLAITMTARMAGLAVDLASAGLAHTPRHSGHRIAVLVHGLCMNDLQWTRKGHDHGAALARDLGYTPVYLRYNSGRHISANGREFADLMEALVRAWPRPIERLVVIGHSMGGLVARSACHHAERAGHAWLDRLDDLVFLGTPHLGAPLEKAGAWVDFLLGISPYTTPFARLGKVRSAGIKDLRHGHLRDEDLQAPAPGPAHASLPLPAGVRCRAIAASTSRRSTASGSRVRGDGLVPVWSALGRHRDPLRALDLPDAHRWVSYETGHLDLLNCPQVYARLKDWLA